VRCSAGRHARQALALTLLLGVSSGARAQDAHYWTRQFGNRAWLLGGAVIGDAEDISAVYYNPGALALIREPQFQFTSNLIEYSRLVVDDREEEEDLVASRLIGSPSLVAGELRLDVLGASRLGYSLLTRQFFEYRIERRDQLTGEEVPGAPGLERLDTDVRLEQRVSEHWAGLTWSHPLGESLAVGVSVFGALRVQRTSLRSLAQGWGPEERAFVSLRGREFRYQNARVLAKVGLSYQREPWGLGVTVTTPGLSLWGRGASALDSTRVGTGPEAPRVVSAFEDRLRARYRTPLSVGVGATRQVHRTTLHVSAEWFAEVPRFTILETTPRFGDGAPRGDVVLRLKPVVNVGVGLEQRLGERLRGYVGFHTDQSAATEEPGIDATLAEWDLYHVAAGMFFTLGRSSFTLGANLAMGDQRARRIHAFLQGEEWAAPTGPVRVRFLQATLVLGGSLQLGLWP
jgi:hypothetical protein